jgi:DNA-binding transcriptional LysR family regulator
MVSVRLDDGVRLAYVAAPDYLANAVPVTTPADLLQHRCINYQYASSTRIHRWSLEQEGETIHVGTPGNLIFDDIDILLEAALAGCGVACVTADQAVTHLRAGNLRQVLADFTPRLLPSYLYYAGRRHVPAPPRALIEALRVRPSASHL